MVGGEIDELRTSFRRVLDDVVSAGAIRKHVDEAALRCDVLWTKARELGWFALLTPEAHGGLGLGRAVAAALYEELGRVVAPLPMMGSLVATELIARFGTEIQQEHWLPRLAQGLIATWSAEEISPDWTGLRLSGDTLTGDARDLLNGPEAGLLLTPARDGSSILWVLADAVGLSMHGSEMVDRTRNLARARLEATPVSPIAGEHEDIARVLRTHAAIAIACDSIGGAKAVLALTVEYMKARDQFGKPIGSFQALKHRCAEHKVAIEAADGLLAQAVTIWESDGAEAELYAMLAKAHVSDVYRVVAEDAVQLHGGIGFTWEHVCHLYLKRAKLNQVVFGTVSAYWDAAARLLVA